MTETPSPARPAASYDRVVLLGFMASGKTQIGKRLARALGWRHVDLDEEIEMHAGRAIAKIFATDGEGAFRSLERSLTPAFLHARDIVFTPGGGWVTNEGIFDTIPPGTLTVWLKAHPDAIVRRATRRRNQGKRPLLDVEDPALRARELLAAREPLYAQADLHISTDNLSLNQVVTQLEMIIRGRNAAGEPVRKNG